ncbi:MAG: formylglycine-generating enzyme family protein [Bacteroidales bacterium]
MKIVGISWIMCLCLHINYAQVIIPEMVFIQGGRFKMGSVAGGSDEKPVHEIVLDDFRIGRFEVTQYEWRLIMDQDTSKRYFEGCDSCPVERVSWNNVQEYLQTLNEKTKMNYRLPTEAEWEFAARGGIYSKAYKYSGSNEEAEVAWKVGNSDLKTHPVGQKKPNELGIYDMTGNVFEWCADWYAPGWYQVSQVKNPKGPVDGNFRIIRGGSWFYDNTGLASSDRESANPSFRYGYVGFRLCCSVSNGNQPQTSPARREQQKKDSIESRKKAFYKKFIGF